MPYRRHMATESRPAMWWESCWTCMTKPSVSRLSRLKALHPSIHPSIHPNIHSETPSLNSRRTLGTAQGIGAVYSALHRYLEKETDRRDRSLRWHHTSPVCWAVCHLRLTFLTLSLPQMLILAAKEVSQLPLTLLLHPHNCHAFNCTKWLPLAM